MKKLVSFILAFILLIGIMFAEYRFIMCSLRPYKGDNGTIYIEFINQVDEYYADPVSEMYK